MSWPITLNVIVILFYVWPRRDGGGIPFSLVGISAAGPGGVGLGWYVLAALILPWLIWWPVSWLLLAT